MGCVRGKEAAIPGFSGLLPLPSHLVVDRIFRDLVCTLSILLWDKIMSKLSVVRSFYVSIFLNQLRLLDSMKNKGMHIESYF